MKKAIWLLVFVLCLCPAFAAVGDVTMYSFKVFVEGDSQDVDFKDGEKIFAVPGDNIEVQMRLDNDYDNYTKVNITGTLIADDDLEEKESVTIQAQQRKLVTFEFNLDEDLDEDEYDLILEYEYEFDDDDYRHEAVMVVDVKDTKDAMTVYSLKAYIDGDPQSLDWEDDIIYANPGDTLELQLRLENEFSADLDVEILGTLFLSEDLERSKDEEIKEGDKKTVVLEYFIPDSERYGTYDLELKYEYKISGKTYDNETTIEVSLRKPQEEQIDRDDILFNLTQELAQTREREEELMTKLATCDEDQSALAECKKKEGQLEEVQKFEQLYNEECTKSEQQKTRADTCEEARKHMYSKEQLDNKVNEAKVFAAAEQQSKDNQLMLGLLVVGGIYWHFNKRQKSVGGKGEGKPLTGTWK